MASITAQRTYHGTLSTTVADDITWTDDGPYQNVAITNRDASTTLYARVIATSERQTITLSSWDSGDTIKFTHNSVESVAVTYASDVSAAIQAALEALASIGTGNVKVTRTDVNNYVARFQNNKAHQSITAITCTSGTGGASGSVAETVAGGSITAVGAQEGTYVILPLQTKTLATPFEMGQVSVVGSGNAYSVEIA